ncbi:MAG TPA: molybdenum cofactor biosynthesis protein MoaE [Anaeromyxobacter sp.]|nr:molybdenum cofactor biosynthesis protein MoaE [Anaeromyxobacter sp.]
MALRILYFAAAREAAGTTAEELAEVPPTVAELRRALVARHPALSRVLPRCRIAVGEELAAEEAPLPDGGEVAVIPPVAGGAPLFAVVDRPLLLDEVVRAVSSPNSGAVVTFTGSVRRHSQGRSVVRLEYEAYRPMAERVLSRIGEEVGAAHAAALAAMHRVGVLSPGEAAVVVAAAAPHRTAAFEACRTYIERLKHEVPIWKREVFEDGSEWVGMGP